MRKVALYSVAIAVAAIVLYTAMLRSPLPRQPSSATSLAAPSAPVATVAPRVAGPAEVSTTVPQAAVTQNVAAPEFGGSIALVSSEADGGDRAAIHVIDRALSEESSWSAAGPSPQDVVIGFFQGRPARVTSVLIDPNTRTAARWAKDVEVWVRSCIVEASYRTEPASVRAAPCLGARRRAHFGLRSERA